MVVCDLENYKYSTEAVQAIKTIKQYCDNNGILYCYVQMPSNDRAKYINGETTATINDMVNRSSIFQQEMENENISFLNLCKDDEFCKNIKFDLSGHWQTKYAFQAMLKVSQYLNEQYNIEMMNYYDREYYSLNGDDHSVLIPKNETYYSISISEEQYLEGDFKSVLIRDSKEWNASYPYSNSFLLDNNHYYKIENLNSINDKKILVLGDSFSWPITTYLSESFSQTMALHPKYFDGAVTKYIEVNQPDIVVMMYYEGQVGGDNNTAFMCIE